jgi:4-amino-4-deoxy-L-arabinose transferase-like glycosyltransferase
MRRENAWLFLLLLVKFALPFFLYHPAYELHRDEFLYYQQGQHLSVGFLENPPLIGLLGYLSSLLGGGWFWIKFWPALFGAATLWVTVQLVKELGGSFYAQLIAALGILFTAYLRIHFLFQPNFLDIFFWTLSACFLVRYINTTNSRYIYYLALSLALGWYSKYSILFMIVALVLSILLTCHRTVFLKKDFWLAVLLGVVAITPNLLWQYFHNWPLFHHMQELQETQLQHLNKADFIKEQILYLLPVAFVWIGGLVWLVRQRAYRVIGYCYLLITVLIMMGSGKGYYALGAYPMMLAAGGVWTEKVSAGHRWLRVSFVVMILVLALPFIPVLAPMQPPKEMAAFNEKYGVAGLGLLRWEDGENHLLQQDFADMLGWKELADKAERLYQQQPPSVKDATIVYCRNYGLAGSIKYYAKDPAFKEKIVSDNGTHLLWIHDSVRFRHLIFIGGEMPGEDDAVFQQFGKVEVVDSCTNIYSRQYGEKIIYYQQARDSAWILAQKDIAELKAKFRR